MEKNTSEFNENFTKIMMKIVIKDTYLKQMLNFPKELHEIHNDLPFLLKRMKIKKCHKLVCNLYDKKKCVAYKRTLKH